MVNVQHQINDIETENPIVNDMETESTGKVRGSRYECNRKYYLKHTHESLRSTLLHTVKTKGRIPSMQTVEKYNLEPEELIRAWRLYKNNTNIICSLKEMKFKVLIHNIL